MCKNLQNVRSPSFGSQPFVMSLTSRVNDNDPCLVCLEPLWRARQLHVEGPVLHQQVFFLHSAANRELNLLFSVERDYSTVWIIDGELNAAELEFCLEVEYLKMSVNNPVLENHHF